MAKPDYIVVGLINTEQALNPYNARPVLDSMLDWTAHTKTAVPLKNTVHSLLHYIFNSYIGQLMPRKIAYLNTSNTQSKGAALPQNTKLTQYVGLFAIGYVLASTIFMMIQTKMTLNSQLVTVLSIFIGAYIAVHKFIKHQRRALNRDEINRLMFGSMAVVWLLTAVYFLGLWLWLFDAVSREVLLEMTLQQPLPLLSALVMIVVLTLVSARISLWVVNRLLDPKHKIL